MHGWGEKSARNSSGDISKRRAWSQTACLRPWPVVCRRAPAPAHARFGAILRGGGYERRADTRAVAGAGRPSSAVCGLCSRQLGRRCCWRRERRGRASKAESLE